MLPSTFSPPWLGGRCFLSHHGYTQGSPGTGDEGEDFSPSDLTLNWDRLGQGDRCPFCSQHGHREGHAMPASQGIMSLRSQLKFL